MRCILLFSKPFSISLQDLSNYYGCLSCPNPGSCSKPLAANQVHCIDCLNIPNEMRPFHNTAKSGTWQCDNISQPMPNQYTAFRNASNNPKGREFRWKQWTSTPRKTKAGDGQQLKGKRSNASNVRRPQRINGLQPSDETDQQDEPLSLQHMPGHSYRVDPLKSYPIVPDQSEMAIIDYFLYGLTPSGGRGSMPQRSRQVSNRRKDPHTDMLLPFFMQHPVLFHALLAACQASLLISRGQSAHEDQTFLLHRSKAVSELQVKLKGKDFADDAALLSVVMLLAAEYLIGNFRGVVAHIAGLNQMIKLKGGLPNDTRWEKFVKSGITAFKSIGYFASTDDLDALPPEKYIEFSIDVLKPLEYPKHPFSIELCNCLSILPAGFSDLILNSQLSTQTIDVLSELQNLQAIGPSAYGKELLRSASPIHPVQAAIQRLSQNSRLNHTEQCICAGLLAYVFQYPALTTMNLFHDPPLQGFIKTLSKPHRAGSEAEQEALVWVYCVIEGVMALRPVRLPKSTTLFTDAFEVYPILKDWIKLEPILKRFFYTELLLDHWKQRWQEAMQSKYPTEFNNSISSTPSISGETETTISISDHARRTPTQPASPSSIEESNHRTVTRCPFRHR